MDPELNKDAEYDKDPTSPTGGYAINVP